MKKSLTAWHGCGKCGVIKKTSNASVAVNLKPLNTLNYWLSDAVKSEGCNSATLLNMDT